MCCFCYCYYCLTFFKCRNDKGRDGGKYLCLFFVIALDWLLIGETSVRLSDGNDKVLLFLC